MPATTRKIASNSDCKTCRCLQTWNRNTRREEFVCPFVRQFEFWAISDGERSCEGYEA